MSCLVLPEQRPRKAIALKMDASPPLFLYLGSSPPVLVTCTALGGRRLQGLLWYFSSEALACCNLDGRSQWQEENENLGQGGRREGGRPLCRSRLAGTDRTLFVLLLSVVCCLFVVVPCAVRRACICVRGRLLLLSLLFEMGR